VAARLLALAVALCAGCIDDSLVRCGDLSCPVGNVCTPGGCAVPADVTACEGKTDGAACKTFLGASGTCAYGACHTDLCGNATIDPGEVCDGDQGVDPTLGQTCAPDCKSIYQCGNATVDPGEQCDDGNANPADGCDACMKTGWLVSTAVGTAVIATSTALANPAGVAIDGSGRVFVADTYNHRIQRIELDGSVTTVAGTGTSGYNGDGLVATSAELAYPGGVAVDGLGRIFIADTSNHRVRRVEVDGTISTIAGTGTQGYNGDAQPAILAEVYAPQGVAVDGLGNVLVADTLNHRVRRIDLDGSIETVAGTGNESFGGDGSAATAAYLDTPYSVAVDSQGRIVIADTLNQRIRRVALDGTIDTVAGDGTAGGIGDGGPATSAELAYPLGITIDTQDRILIADTFSQEIRRIDTAGMISRVAGSGAIGFSGDGGAATAATLQYPQAVAVDGAGHIAIADTNNQRVRWVSSGTISTVAGTGMFGFGGDGAQATSALLSSAFGVTVDNMSRVLIADTFNSRVRRVELDGTITTVAGTGSYGSGGDGGPATSALLANADYVAVDATGRVLIADTYNHSIRRVELDGTIHTVAGTGSSGYNGDGIPATSAQLFNPNGVAVDAQGRILICDTYNQRVRRVELDGTISTVAGTGAFGYGGDNVPATSTPLGYPYGIAVDGLGGILVADTSNHRIRRIDSGGIITTLAGTGTQGFNGDGIAATSAQLYSPYGVAVDLQGRVVLTDTQNERIRRIDSAGIITTIAGTGVLGSSGDAGPATSAQVAGPLGVSIDKQGRVVIMDTNNLRVRRIETDGTIDTVAGQVDPDNIGPIAKARLEDVQAIAIAPGLTLAAGGTSGTLEAVLGGNVVAVAGQYPQTNPTGALARYRTAAFGTVGGTAIDATTGAIYLSETSSNRLHVVTQTDPSNPKTWTITTLANNAGTAGFVDGAAATAQFREPSGLWLAGSTLYIADTGNHAIRALDLTTHMVTTIVNASGALGYGGDGGAATAALLYRPAAVTQCPGGDLFIADTGNNRVRRVAAGVISTVLGDGVPASSGEGTPARTFPVDAPRGLACDPFGNLFVTSSTTVRLLPASDGHVVDGSGPVQTIYGGPPRDKFPASVTACLTGLAVTSATSVQVADACTGLLVQLQRQ
jgi:cysteine-rich repeat protein